MPRTSPTFATGEGPRAVSKRQLGDVRRQPPKHPLPEAAAGRGSKQVTAKPLVSLGFCASKTLGSFLDALRLAGARVPSKSSAVAQTLRLRVLGVGQNPTRCPGWGDRGRLSYGSGASNDHAPGASLCHARSRSRGRLATQRGGCEGTRRNYATGKPTPPRRLAVLRGDRVEVHPTVPDRRRCPGVAR